MSKQENEPGQPAHEPAHRTDVEVFHSLCRTLDDYTTFDRLISSFESPTVPIHGLARFSNAVVGICISIVILDHNEVDTVCRSQVIVASLLSSVGCLGARVRSSWAETVAVDRRTNRSVDLSPSFVVTSRSSHRASAGWMLLFKPQAS